MESLEQRSFDLGWDYATFGINVPEDADKLFCDGYRAFGSEHNKTTQKPTKYVRKWLQIRFGAWRRGKAISAEVTPEYIKKIKPAADKCPVTGQRFTYSTGEPTDWSVDRANNERGYIRGNIVIISQRANVSKGDKSLGEIRALAQRDIDTEGLTPSQWAKLAQLIEPAFGDHDDEVNPIPILFGQPVALGMPVSPLAGFQVVLSRILLDVWDLEKRRFVSSYVHQIQRFVCRTRRQRKAFDRLVTEVIRRSKHIRSYAEVWATPRIQKRLWAFVNTLGGAGLTRLARLQEITVGDQNTRIA